MKVEIPLIGVGKMEPATKLSRFGNWIWAKKSSTSSIWSIRQLEKDISNLFKFGLFSEVDPQVV